MCLDRSLLPILMVVSSLSCKETLGESSSAASCASIVAEQKKLVASLPSVCKSDADCVCYGGGTPATDCGGYAARPLASRIDALNARYEKSRCRPTVSCAPSRCNPGCVSGKCEERPTTTAQAVAAQSCSIKITVTSFGATAEVWQVEGGKIRVQTFLRDKKVKVDRQLTPAERERLRSFTKTFPLGELKTRYVSNVRGEASTTYEIRIGTQTKTIYQYFKEQKDLTALWQLLRSFAAPGKAAAGGFRR